MASMHSLFNWAIQHTDQNALHQSVVDGTATNTIPKDLMEAILQSDAEKMATLVKMYQNESTSLAEKETCLEELEFFAQIIDNANDLNHPSVNALKLLIDGLKDPQPTLRALCAFALGTALQNNPKVQIQVVQMNGLSELLAGFRAELANPNYYSLFILSKLLYALISLLDQNPKIQKEFRDASGFNLLHEIMSKPASYFDFPKPSTSSDTKSEQNVDDEDEEKEKDPNIVEVVDIVDRVKKSAQKQRNLVTETTEQQYIRLVRRVIFLLLKLISQTEQFKLAFVKDLNGILVEDILALATKYSSDFDIVDKTTAVLTSLTSGTMKSYVISELKKWKPNLEHLLTLIEEKENLNDVLKAL